MRHTIAARATREFVPLDHSVHAIAPEKAGRVVGLVALKLRSSDRDIAVVFLGEWEAGEVFLLQTVKRTTGVE